MARRPEHLLLRGNIWWLRVRVPDELRSIIGKTEIRRSLKTSDSAEAKRLVRIARIKVEAEFDDARHTLAQSPAGHAGKRKPIELTEEQVWALATRWFVEQEKRNVDRTVDPHDEDLIQARTEDLAFVEQWDEVSASVNAEVQKLLAEAGIAETVELGQPALWRGKLNRAIHAAMIESQRRLLNRTTGGRGIVLDQTFHGLSAATNLQPVAISAVTLSDLIKRYDRDPSKPRPSRKTQMKLDAQRRLFKEVIGKNTLLNAIDREKARKLLDILKVLPANTTKKFKGKAAPEITRIAEERRLAPMSVATANSYMGAFVSLLDYAVAEGLIEKNPAMGLRLASDGVKRKDKRFPFTVADLNAIFAAPLYSGCVDDGRGYGRPGPNRPRRGRFWVPLVSLYSGMRLNEICQLTEDDIAVEDGAEVILVRADEDVIATGAGGVLITLGLLTTPQGAAPVGTSQRPPSSAGASADTSAVRKIEWDEALKSEAWIAKAKDVIKERLKDPRSAEFRRLVVSRTGGVPMVCGEVSSKNSFGGRNGFQRAVSAARPDLTFLEEEVEDMDSVWRKFC